MLRSERFVDSSPAQVWATLLDEGRYLGVTKTHSLPCTSTDNPYAEAQYKTLKYRPGFPERFESIEVSRDLPTVLRGTTTRTATRASG